MHVNEFEGGNWLAEINKRYVFGFDGACQRNVFVEHAIGQVISVTWYDDDGTITHVEVECEDELPDLPLGFTDEFRIETVRLFREENHAR